jgi:hypothetical protein
MNSTGTMVNSYRYDPYGVATTATENVDNVWR